MVPVRSRLSFSLRFLDNPDFFQMQLNAGQILLLRDGVGCKVTWPKAFALGSIPLCKKKKFKHEMMEKVRTAFASSFCTLNGFYLVLEPAAEIR